jgi:hypothetical protein
VSLRHFHSLPINFYWDDEDARLLCCQVRCAPHLAALNATKTNDVDQQQYHHQQKAKNSTTFSESLAYIMFVTNKCELKELETVNLSLGEQLENLCAPHIVSINSNKKKKQTEKSTFHIIFLGIFPFENYGGSEK